MILHRYILGQVLGPVLAAFVSLNLLFLVVQLLKVAEVAVGGGLDLGDLLHVAVLFLPGFAVLIIPVSVLVGVMLGFGRLAGDGELVALASAGVSTHRLAVMPLAVGALATLASVLVAGTLAPASADRLHRTFVELSKRHVAASLSPGRFFEEIPGVVLYPRRPAAGSGTWDGFLMHDRRQDRGDYILLAGRARVGPRGGTNQLQMDLSDGEVHKYDGWEQLYSVGRFERATIGLNIDRLVHDRTRFIPLTERLSTPDLWAASRDPERSPRERILCASAGHRRLAFPAASFLFALLGTALVASGKLRGRRRTLLASVMVVTGYYLLMRLGDAAAASGWLGSAAAAWLPDLLVAGLGLWWLVRLGRKPG